MERVAVVALAYGGPGSLEEVEPFLRRIMAPREPSPEAVAGARRRYELIGGRSPLVENTLDLARELQARLDQAATGGADGATGTEYRVFVGMRHTEPGIPGAVRAAADFADRSIVALVLASHGSERATGAYRKDLESAFSALPAAARRRLCAPVAVDPWHSAPPYLEAVAERVREAAASLAERAGGGIPTVMFTAHSVPVAAGGGDPEYERGLLATVEGVLGELGEGFPWVLAYQSASRGRGGEWLGPEAASEVRRLAGTGVDRLVVMPLGFVSEHLETLYDLDIELAAEAACAGVVMQRARTVQGTEGLVQTLAEAVRTRSTTPAAGPEGARPMLSEDHV